MTQELWSEVDRFFTGLWEPDDPVLAAALAESASSGLPDIQVTAPQGRLLWMLARLCQARAILEIGTLGGYSTIWLGRALPPGGRLVTLEANPRHATVARTNLARAGLAEQAELRLGPALDSLAQLAQEGLPPFDLVFIDADKPSYPDYFDWALRLARPGSLIIADNVVRRGEVIDPSSEDPGVQAARRFAEHLAAEPRVRAVALQTVGAKGYDGLALALVL